jgi:predicted transcriptional regulator
MYEYFAQVSQEAINVKPPYRGKVEMSHFGDYILIKSEIKGEIQRRWFYEERPIFYYYLPKDARIPFVAKLVNAGFTAKEIAELIGLSVTTIASDIKEATAHGLCSEFSVLKAVDKTPADLVLKSTVNQKPVTYVPQPASATTW